LKTENGGGRNMSWLASRKKGNRIIAWEYRYKERGLTKSRSTGTADKGLAKKIKKKWDAALTLMGTSAFEDNKAADLSIANQADLFLQDKAAEIKQSTLKRYRQQIQHVLQFFKKYKIRFFDQLNSSIMKRYKIERADQSAAPKTIFEELALFRSIINTLVQEEIIDADPVRAWPKIKRLPGKPETLGCYSEDEVGRLLDYFQGTSPVMYDIFLFAVYTGCRYGEIKLVKVNDVDFRAHTVRVTNQKTGRNRFDLFEEIRVSSHLIEMLRQRSEASLPQAWLFPELRMHSDNWCRRALKAACQKLDIQYRRFHGTRHTYITAGLSAGIPAPFIQHQARHSRLSTTDNYAKSRMLPIEMAELIQFPRNKRN
jgi:integrase